MTDDENENRDQKKGRFGKLEHWPLVKNFRRSKDKGRFTRLEIDGKKIEIEVRKEAEEEIIVCPKCKRPNPKETAYCLYCEHVFNQTLVEQNEKDIELRSWQKRCPQCKRVIPLKENRCLFCGWAEEESLPRQTIQSEETLLREGETIILTIDGQVYSSKDRFIPPDVKELMIILKRDGYSQETINQWMRTNRPMQRSREWMDIDWLGRRWRTPGSYGNPSWLIIARVIVPLIMFAIMLVVSCVSRGRVGMFWP